MQDRIDVGIDTVRRPERTRKKKREGINQEAMFFLGGGGIVGREEGK